MRQYIVDAFTDQVFRGNPAAICILDKWLPEDLLMSITVENNLSETAFAVKEDDSYHLRWFTPGGEIDLCGHATLACAFVLMGYYETSKSTITFRTLSGELSVTKCGDLYEMDFPAYQLRPVEVTAQMIDAIGAVPAEAYMGRDLLCVLEDENAVLHLNPDQEHGINGEETQRSIVDGGSDRLECDQPVQGFDLRQPVDVIEDHAGKQSRKGPGDNDRDQRVE